MGPSSNCLREPDGVAFSARFERHMHTHQHADGEQGSTIFDRKVCEVAKRLDIATAQVREVFATYDAISMEWAHSDEVERCKASPR